MLQTGGKPVSMGLRHEYDECIAINQDLRKDVASTPPTPRTEKHESEPEDTPGGRLAAGDDRDRDNTDDAEGE